MKRKYKTKPRYVVFFTNLFETTHLFFRNKQEAKRVSKASKKEGNYVTIYQIKTIK